MGNWLQLWGESGHILGATKEKALSHLLLTWISAGNGILQWLFPEEFNIWTDYEEMNGTYTHRESELKFLLCMRGGKEKTEWALGIVGGEGQKEINKVSWMFSGQVVAYICQVFADISGTSWKVLISQRQFQLHRKTVKTYRSWEMQAMRHYFLKKWIHD